MDKLHKLQRASEYADYLIESARQHPMKLLKSHSEFPKWSSLDDKLVNLYAEESTKQLHCKELIPTSHLLRKLVQKEKLNTLVINLYPANEGYSLMLKGRNGCDTETIKLPYEESEMLEYIDNEELPPILVDLLDRAQANIYYSGCIIVEMRDYRRTTNNTCDIQYVLLRPTSHSLLCDINTLTNDGHRWTQEDKLTLESQLILATEEPLCLDPSPAVSMVATRLNYEKHKFNTTALKKSVKRYSQAAVNRKRKLAQCPAPKYLRLHDFVVKKKDQLKGVPPVNLKVGKTKAPRVKQSKVITTNTCVDTWRQQEVQLSAPESIDVEKYAKVIERSKITLDNTPVTVEEYTFETECSQGKVNFKRLAIQQRMTDDYYIGELYVDHDYTEGKLKGSTCKFPLGTKANVEKYITQFRYSFEEDRKVVKITHTKPGHPPQVTYAQPIPPNTSTTPIHTSTSQTSTQAIISQATSLAASITGQMDPNIAPVQASEANTTGKSAAPIKLQLSLNTGMTGVGGANLISPPIGGALQSPVGGAHAQLTLNLPQQALAAQRLRQMSSGFASPPGRPPSTPSPVSQPNSVSQLPSYTQATAMASISVATTSAAPVVKIPTPSPTPPPNSRTPTPNSVRSSGEVMTSPHPLPQGINLSSFIQASNAASSTVTSDSSASSQHQAPPNINIANITGLPANINIQNLASLQGMGLGLHGLQNVQVSLAAVPVSVPFSMVNSTPTSSLITSPAGLQLIGSLPGAGSLTTTASNTGSSTDVRIAATSSGANLVTMVTSLPSTLSSQTSSSASTSIAVTTAGLLSSSTPVLSSTGSGMLQLPIGMAGSLTQFVTTAGLKNTSQGLRAAPPPLSVLQIPGQQPIHLLSTNIHQARAQLAAQAQQTSKVSAAAGALSPNTGLLATPSLQTPVTALSQLTGTTSRSAATPFISLAPQQPNITQQQLTQQQNLTQQQLVQQQSITLQQQQNITQQQLAQLAFLQQQHLKQQQLQQQQQHQPSSQSRSKSKKRATPTPPKNT